MQRGRRVSHLGIAGKPLWLGNSSDDNVVARSEKCDHRFLTDQPIYSELSWRKCICRPWSKVEWYSNWFFGSFKVIFIRLFTSVATRCESQFGVLVEGHFGMETTWSSERLHWLISINQLNCFHRHPGAGQSCPSLCGCRGALEGIDELALGTKTCLYSRKLASNSNGMQINYWSGDASASVCDCATASARKRENKSLSTTNAKHSSKMLCTHESHMDMALSAQQFPQTVSSLLGRFCLFW